MAAISSDLKLFMPALIDIFLIGLCNKFRDQSSVNGLSRQWVEFQKVRAWRLLTTKISMCVDRRYLYLFPGRKSTQCWRYSYALGRKSVQKITVFVMNECLQRENRTKIVFTFLFFFSISVSFLLSVSIYYTCILIKVSDGLYDSMIASS